MLYEAAIEIQKHFAFISALLCGFSITFLIGLLQLKKVEVKRTLRWCLISTTSASFALLISTFASLGGAIWLSERPQLVTAQTAIKSPELSGAYSWGLISLYIGLFALILTIGLSGRLHSKFVGRMTMSIALISFILILFFWLFVVRID
ncbi:MAG: hypothetical protein HKN09_01010 [Saprospiraceae bacterium]|nr:hypothetical protein [Saprospiraceae bacterium]